jgi:hypothetical protein
LFSAARARELYGEARDFATTTKEERAKYYKDGAMAKALGWECDSRNLPGHVGLLWREGWQGRLASVPGQGHSAHGLAGLVWVSGPEAQAEDAGRGRRDAAGTDVEEDAAGVLAGDLTGERASFSNEIVNNSQKSVNNSASYSQVIHNRGGKNCE